VCVPCLAKKSRFASSLKRRQGASISKLVWQAACHSPPHPYIHRSAISTRAYRSTLLPPRLAALPTPCHAVRQRAAESAESSLNLKFTRASLPCSSTPHRCLTSTSGVILRTPIILWQPKSPRELDLEETAVNMTRKVVYGISLWITITGTLYTLVTP
jgi:hypothetical protein